MGLVLGLVCLKEAAGDVFCIVLGISITLFVHLGTSEQGSCSTATSNWIVVSSNGKQRYHKNTGHKSLYK